MTEHASPPKQDDTGQVTLAAETKRAVIGGVIAGGIILLGSFSVGSVGSYEALALLETMLPTTRFLCSAIMTVSGTILALMLTLLAFSRDTQPTLKEAHYEQIQQIALLVTISLIAAVTLLLFVNIPLPESEETLWAWYWAIYYFILIYSAALGGTLIAAVLMLYNAIGHVITIFHPNRTHEHLVVSEDEQ